MVMALTGIVVVIVKERSFTAENEVPPEGKFPLPLEVVLDKQVATIKAASTAAQ